MSELKFRRSKKDDLKTEKQQIRQEQNKERLKGKVVETIDQLAITEKKVLKDVLNLLMNSKKTFPWYNYHENASCLSCDHVAKSMIRTGSIIFCVDCFTSIFDAKAESRDRNIYKKWLDIQTDKWDKEYEWDYS